ncbi:hypothetical protein GNX71_11820 [Variovorax sp. RKNM96]|uniref:DUF7668 domain-containing protein n=1 Tax=Variovorax sp. RKNM96 TaxID=2681552 RepID=UPI00197CD03E|nr:hypothetical protein [Variovorax sp. RKNM96]QSI30234.1 hypothetical protein GNX71_11820 [Variovorax sp. RKNM96]
MTIENEDPEILAVKDEETQRPIPSAWRPVIRQIADAFANGDYGLSVPIAGVEPISLEDAERIKDYIEDYGETLTALSDETWDSSVCIWMGKRWEALVDLWTLSEGRSDLVLSLRVSEVEDGFAFHVHMVYVP